MAIFSAPKNSQVPLESDFTTQRSLYKPLDLCACLPCLGLAMGLAVYYPNFSNIPGLSVQLPPELQSPLRLSTFIQIHLLSSLYPRFSLVTYTLIGSIYFILS